MRRGGGNGRCANFSPPRLSPAGQKGGESGKKQGEASASPLVHFSRYQKNEFLSRVCQLGTCKDSAAVLADSRPAARALFARTLPGRGVFSPRHMSPGKTDRILFALVRKCCEETPLLLQLPLGIGGQVGCDEPIQVPVHHRLDVPVYAPRGRPRRDPPDFTCAGRVNRPLRQGFARRAKRLCTKTAPRLLFQFPFGVCCQVGRDKPIQVPVHHRLDVTVYAPRGRPRGDPPDFTCAAGVNPALRQGFGVPPKPLSGLAPAPLCGAPDNVRGTFLKIPTCSRNPTPS